jgi:hypothetical protein
MYPQEVFPGKFRTEGEYCMKKVLVGLLMLAMAGGVFAQADVSVSGVTRLDFGLGIDFGQNDEVPSATRRDPSNSWVFGDGDAKLGVTGTAGAVRAGVTLQAKGGDAGLDGWFAAVDLSPVELKVGYGFLPWVQWSSLDFFGDNNYGFGAAAVKDRFIQITFSKDSITAYGGLMAEGVNGETLKDKAVFPGFFVGGDFAQEGKFSFGAAFAGVPRAKDWSGARPYYPDWLQGFVNGISGGTILLPQGNTIDESRFGWMADLHGKIFFDPLTIGLNIALYGDPSMSAAYITPGGWVTGNKEDFILEGLLDVGIALAPCDIGVTAGFVSNLAEREKGGGKADLKLGADAAFTLGGGFKVIPGLKVVLPLAAGGQTGGKDNKVTEKGAMDIGVSFGYSF